MDDLNKNNNAYLKRIFQLREPIPRFTYFFVAIASILLILIFWIILTNSQFIEEYFLPSPMNVISSIYTLFVRYNLLSDILASIYRIFLGFLLSCLIAVPLGILMGNFKIVEAFFEPIVDFIRYIPAVALIPLCILWFGIGEFEKIMVIFLGTFFQLLLLISDVSANVPREYLEIAYTLGLSKKQIIRDVLIPAALPGICDNLRIVFGWAWTYVIVAEIVGATSGVGHMIVESQRFLKTANVIAGVFIIGILGFLTDCFFKLGYRILFPWSMKGN